MSLRLARPDDLAELTRIEEAASVRFTDLRLALPPGTLPRSALLAAIDAELVFVIDEDPPVAFAACEAFPDGLHLHEIDVHPARQGQGLGRRLLDRVAAAARARGLPRVTLTTFRDVPFNGPFYERYGFVAIPEPSPRLADLLAEEARHGIDAAPRVAMALAVGG